MRVSELRQALSRCSDEDEVVIVPSERHGALDIAEVIVSPFGWRREDGSCVVGHVMLRIAEGEVSS